jgi:chromosome segregation ATPase
MNIIEIKEKIADWENQIDRAEIRLEKVESSMNPNEELEEKLMDWIGNAVNKLAELKEQLAEQTAREQWNAQWKAWKLPTHKLEDLGKGPAPPLEQ